jgi:MYXO-CTERM domain-containing protein
MRPEVAIFLGFVIVALPRAANAADFYVDASAAPSGDGSMSKPFQTINAALAGLSRGDTVWIATGTYDETVDVENLSGTGRTTFRASPGAKPVIDGTSGSASAGFVLQSGVADVTFMGLTIQNALGGALGVQFYYADGGQVVDCTTKNMSSNAVTFYYSSQGEVRGSTLQGNVAGRKTTGTVVTNNEIYGASAEGVGLYDGSTGCTVAHNQIHDNYSVNLYLDSISHSTFDGNLIYETNPDNDLEGIEISDEYYSDLAAPVNSYNTIINNVVFGNNEGIVFWLSGEWPTQALNDQSGLRYDVIANNTVVGNKGSLKWDASPAHVGTTIENNIFAANAASSPIYLLQANSAGGISLDHNLWYEPSVSQAFLWVGDQVDHSGFVSMSMQGSDDVLSDPAFVGAWSAPPATNLELTKASPAIGAGVTVSAVTDDYLGATRPAGHYDIGAFQYGATAPSDGGTSHGSDGGVPVSPDGSAPTGRDAGSDGAATSESPGKSESSSGCSCTSAGERSGGDGALAFGVAGLVLSASRRRRSSRRGSRRACPPPWWGRSG